MKAILKSKGPGRGWWGPPKGTHTARAVPGGKRDQIPAQNDYAKRRAIEAAERGVRSAAASLGISEEEAERAAANTVNAALEYDVAIRAPIEVASTILEEGQFKNQHATGHSRGSLNPEYRSKAEKSAFEIKGDSPSDFPIYGIVDVPGSGGAQYGDVKFVLTPQMKAKTTMTVGDSLGGFKQGSLTGTPILSPGKEAWDGKVEQLALANGRPASVFRPMPRSLLVPTVDYFEAQIHGGVKASDIAFIEIRPPLPTWTDEVRSYAALKRSAEKLKIPIYEVSS